MSQAPDRARFEALLHVGDVQGAVAFVRSHHAPEVEDEVRIGLRPLPTSAVLQPIVDELWSLLPDRFVSHPPATDGDIATWIRQHAREEKHRAISRVVMKLSAEGRGPAAATLARAFYADLVMARVVGRGLRGADADDVFQELWMRVVKQMGQYRGDNGATLRAWIVKITAGAIADALDERARTRARCVDASLPELPATTPTWLRSTFRRSMRENLWKLLNEECTAEQREILIQRFLVDREKQLSWNDLAAIWTELGHPKRSAAWLQLRYTQLKRWLHERLSR